MVWFCFASFQVARGRESECCFSLLLTHLTQPLASRSQQTHPSGDREVVTRGAGGQHMAVNGD